MRHMKKIFALAFAAALSICAAAESVRLVIDKSVYVAGDLIWCSAFCLEGNALSSSSAIAYVELVSRDGVAVKAKIALVSGRGAGAVSLPANIPTGNYLIFAYTAASEAAEGQVITVFNTMSGARVRNGVELCNEPMVEPEGGIGELQHFCQNGYEGVGGNTHLVNADGLYTYLGNMLKANGVTSYGLTPKNVLLARLGISHFLKHMGHYETYFTGEDTQKDLREYFKGQMEANKPGKRFANSETYQMSAILLSVFTPNDSKGNVVLKA